MLGKAQKCIRLLLTSAKLRLREEETCRIGIIDPILTSLDTGHQHEQAEGISGSELKMRDVRDLNPRLPA
jgi:hypothetical protein